jgi:hypothetical protein
MDPNGSKKLRVPFGTPYFPTPSHVGRKEMNILLPENSVFRINSSKLVLNQRASGLGYIHDIPIVVLYRSPKKSFRVSDNNRKVTC